MTRNWNIKSKKDYNEEYFEVVVDLPVHETINPAGIMVDNLVMVNKQRMKKYLEEGKTEDQAIKGVLDETADEHCDPSKFTI